MSRTTISRDAFRRSCSRFATGVAVATVVDAAGQPHGLTINSFTSVSADPPLVLICIDRACSLLALFQAQPYYGLSFLSEQQQEISMRFATVPEGRFQGVEWTSGDVSGVPLLAGCVGWMECRVWQQIDAGDHVVFLAEVEQAEAREGRPLLFFASGYQALG